MIVPDIVPSVFHSSCPFVPSSAENQISFPITESERTFASPLGLMFEFHPFYTIQTNPIPRQQNTACFQAPHNLGID